MKTKKGFTIIELLIVIAIIGMLTSVIFASIGSTRSKARDSQRVSDIKEIQIALQHYYDACGKRYPGNITQPQSGTGPGCPITTPVTNLNTFINPIPTDPLTGTAYTYAAFGPGIVCSVSYHLGASLENTSNFSLTSDFDVAAGAQGATCSSSQDADFTGLSNAIGGNKCGATAGTGQPGGTETCFDLKP